MNSKQSFQERKQQVQAFSNLRDLSVKANRRFLLVVTKDPGLIESIIEHPNPMGVPQHSNGNDRNALRMNYFLGI